MKYLEWQNEYSVGIERIDEQHKKIIDMLNRLQKSILELDDEEQENVFNDMVDYAKEHFSEEENFMMSKGYPHLEEHKREHKVFIDKVQKLNENENKNVGVSLDMMSFLHDWLIKHILYSDKKYSL